MSQTIFTQRNVLADILQAKCDFRRKTAVLRFEPLLGAYEQRTMIVLGSLERLLISVDWTFFTRCYAWFATGKYRFKIGDIAPAGGRLPQIT